MHRAGARAAPDGSARAAHRDAAAPLASEHGGGVTERVATLLLSLHRGIIRRPAVCTCRPPVRLDLCVGECGGLSLSVRVRPPPARIFSDSLQGPARENEALGLSKSRLALRNCALCPWRCAIVRLELYWVLVASPCARSSFHPCLNCAFASCLAIADRRLPSSDRIGSQHTGIWRFRRWVAPPHWPSRAKSCNQNQY